MFCSHCGAENLSQGKFCGQCGHTLLVVVPPVIVPEKTVAVAPKAVEIERKSPTTLFAFAGLIVGGVIGFLMRPSAMLFGQLPFETVITRGASLSGIDMLLVPTAQSSFNVMAIGALVGMVAGVVVSRLTARR